MLTFPITLYAGAASFPAVVTTNSSAENTSTTSHTVNLPASIVAGNLLLIIWQSAALGITVTTPSGWTALGSPVTNGNNIQFIVYYKTASGSEGATQAISTNNNTPAAHVSYQISTYQGAPEVATATGTSANPDPPSLSPSWGFDKTLWLAISDSVRVSTSHSVTGTPSGYTNVVSASEDLGGTGTSYRLWTLRKEAQASSENPGSFTLSNSLDWCAATLAIHGV